MNFHALPCPSFHSLYNLIKRTIQDWDRKAQVSFEQATVLVGQAKQLCSPLSLWSLTVESPEAQMAAARWHGTIKPSKQFQ